MTLAHTILLAALALSAAPQFEVQPLSGPPTVGSLVALDADRVTLETAKGRVSLAVADLLGVSAKQQPSSPLPPQAWVELVDGSSLWVRAYAVRQGRARIEPTVGEAIDLPAADVAAVRFQPAAAAVLDQWERLLKIKARRRPAGGRKTGLARLPQGNDPRRDREDNRVRTGRRVGRVNRLKVFGLIYRAAERDPPSRSHGSPTPAVRAGRSARWPWPAVRGTTVAGGDRATAARTGGADRPVARKDRLPQRPEAGIVRLHPLLSLRQGTARAAGVFPARAGPELWNRSRCGWAASSSPRAWPCTAAPRPSTICPADSAAFEAVAGIDDDVRVRGATST